MFPTSSSVVAAFPLIILSQNSAIFLDLRTSSMEGGSVKYRQMFSLSLIRYSITFSKCWIFLKSRLTPSCQLASSLVSLIYLHFDHFGSRQVRVLIHQQAEYLTQTKKLKSCSLTLDPSSEQLKAPSPTISSYRYWLKFIMQTESTEIIMPKSPPAQERISSILPMERSIERDELEIAKKMLMFSKYAMDSKFQVRILSSLQPDSNEDSEKGMMLVSVVIQQGERQTRDQVPLRVVKVDLTTSMYLMVAFLLVGLKPVLMNTVLQVKYFLVLIQYSLIMLIYSALAHPVNIGVSSWFSLLQLLRVIESNLQTSLLG